MFKKKEYPVFLIKGFLEAGKTQFIKDAVITDGFHQRGDTLLFLLEEGIEEYPKKLLEENYTSIYTFEKEEDFTVENMEKVVEIVKAEYTLDKMIFISFSFENLLNLRKVCPESHCQFLTGEFKDEIIEMLKEHKMGIDIWSNALDEEWKVKKLLDEGIEVNVWTVDNKELAEKLISWGVQYVTSNILE
jgi:glycerophosphoryl diester phosphodiesterase